MKPKYLKLINQSMIFLGKKQQWIVLLLIILVFTFTSCYEMVYEPQYAEIVNVKQYVSLREKPEGKSQVEGTIAKGEQVEVLLYENDGWAHVKYKEQYGYVKSQYLRLIELEDEQAIENTSGKSLISLLLDDVKKSWWPKILLLFMLLSPLFARFIPNEIVADVWFKLWILVIMLIPASFIAMIWIKLTLYIQHLFLWIGQIPFIIDLGKLVAATNSKTIMFIYTFFSMGVVYLLIVIGPLLPLKMLNDVGKGRLVLKVVYAAFMSAIIIGTIDPDYTDSMPNIIADFCRWFQSSWNIHLSEYSNRSDYAVIDTITILASLYLLFRFNDD